VQAQAVGYTSDGRMASLNPGIQTPDSQYITSLSYNQDAQLSAVNAGSGSLASYTYDGFGQRLVKTVSGSYGEIYQYGQNGLLLEETDTSGMAQADYIYLNGRPVAVLNGSTFYYLHDDRLGTPQVASDSSQNIQWQASYEPFGTTTSVSGTITQNLRFPGQYFDVESGWNHNGFRDYLPALGRYAEPDPLGRLGSGNDLYAYADDNPANLIDPLGLCAAMISAQNNKQVCSSGGDPSWYPASGAFVAAGEYTNGVTNQVSYQPTVGRFLAMFNPGQGTYTSDTSETYLAGGFYAGVGAGLMISNANNISQLQLTNSTYTISTPWLSISWSTGGGVWEGQATLGPGAVFAYSHTASETKVKSNNQPCPTY